MEQIRAASQKVQEMITGLSESMKQQVAAVKELSQALEQRERDEPEHLGGNGGADHQCQAGVRGGGERERRDARRGQRCRGNVSIHGAAGRAWHKISRK